MAWPTNLKWKGQSIGVNPKIPRKNKVLKREWTEMVRQEGKKIPVRRDGQEIEIS